MDNKIQTIINKFNINILFNYNILFFVVISFIFIAIYNSFMFVGIIEDGHHHFWEAITSINPFIGHEGFNSFPFNSRLFPNVLSHGIVSFLSKYNICDIKILLYIFTFISYINPLIFLVLIYINLPKTHKSIFEFITLSFLISLMFMFYQIWTENLLTGLFIWGIFVIYKYNELNNLSKINIFSLVLFSFLIISSHPIAVIFIPIILLIAIEKYIKTNNINFVSKCAILSSFILLIIAFFFNFYYIINPIFLENSYFNFSIFLDYKYIIFFLSILIVVILSMIKTKIFLKLLFTLSIISLLLVSIFSFPPNLSFIFRGVSLYSLFIFFILLIFLSIKNIQINYKLIHILNLTIILILLSNSIYYGNKWHKYIETLDSYNKNYHSLKLNNIAKFDLAHNHAFAFIFVITYYCFNNSNNITLHIKKTNSWISNHIQSQLLNKDNVPKYINVKKLINID